MGNNEPHQTRAGRGTSNVQRPASNIEIREKRIEACIGPVNQNENEDEEESAEEQEKEEEEE
jgi:hypothetical protein